MMANGSVTLQLLPGLIFSPTDEELVLHFLHSKASLSPCHPNINIIPDHDHLSLLDPWQLNGEALSSGNQYYFFTKVKENRATENGYWKETGVTEPIVSSAKKVGIKKYLVFIIEETQTSWVMQEYHICSSAGGRRTKPADHSWSKWILCRVYEKNISQKGISCYRDDDNDDDDSNGTELSLLDQVYMSLDDDLEETISLPNLLD